MTEMEYIGKCSKYLHILLRNNPGYGEWLLGEGNLNRKYPLTELYSVLVREAAEAQSFNDLLRIYRRFKQLHFLRIGARDLMHYSDLSETTGQLSDLASVALQVGLETFSSHPDWWVSGEEMDLWRRLNGRIPLVVLGLGKLGGHELNYVSDVDLIFLYTGGGEDRENSLMLLSRLTHRISRLLSDQFEGDRFFQVDFRLRPQGKQGILVPSMSGALEHYLLHGQAWERQMLLKCRPVAGERSEGTAFVHELRPFVFRRFLDFQAIDELRAMRSRILTEAVPFLSRAKYFDVKLGIGGIREVEFFVQSLQLIYGGRHLELDEPNTLRCLEKLAGLGILPRQTAVALKISYTFLRNVEHYIQLDQNRQTQRVPSSKEESMRLVFAMGFGEDEAAFLEALRMHCSNIHARFQELFREKSEQDDTEDQKPRAGLPKDLGTFQFLAEPFEKFSKTLKAYPPSVQTEILSGVLEKYNCISDRDLLGKILARLDTFFGRVARRTGLIRLFGSAEPWLAPFGRAIASSELFAGLLSHNPALVEGLALRSGAFNRAPEWEASSTRIVEAAPGYVEKLEWIRRLKNERILQIALADLGGRIDFGALEEEHTALAEFVITRTLAAVGQNLGMRADLPLSVIAMGKLGSGEMSYLSDLDLVFVYSPEAHEPENQIPIGVVRLIQRLMNMLATPLQEGPGYEMDARLRPTGTHGPLVVTKKSWLEYYETRADIWEIQAMLRSRPIAGDPGLGEWIDGKATEICFRQRQPEAVWPRICHLRYRMEKERAAETETEIDLKLGMGGLADVEFIVQGLALEGNRAAGNIKAADRRRSLRIALQEGFSESGPTRELSAAFRALRALDHRIRLHANSSAAKLDEQRFETMVSLGLWPPRFDGGSIETWPDILRVRREIRTIFRKFCP
jgi:glutamate-ammonia-ligase adenylyltransferase